MAVRSTEAIVRSSERVVRSQSSLACCGSGAHSRAETAAHILRSSAYHGSGGHWLVEAAVRSSEAVVVRSRSWLAYHGSGRCKVSAAVYVVPSRR